MPSFRLIPIGLATAAVVATGAATASGHPAPSPAPPTITVYKTASCGCCKQWVEHLRAEGFKVAAHDLDDLDETKTTLGVHSELRSCHTAVVDGYVIEGHVPADDIERLLKERPKVVGLAVPGMPMGSPGMEGSRKDSYEVVTFDKQGKTTVYARH